MRNTRPTLTATVAVSFGYPGRGLQQRSRHPAAAPAAAHCEMAFLYGVGVGPDTGQKADGMLAFDKAEDGTLTGPTEGDLGDWVAASSGDAGGCPPGASYPPQRGIDRTAFRPCIPNFYL